MKRIRGSEPPEVEGLPEDVFQQDEMDAQSDLLRTSAPGLIMLEALMITGSVTQAAKSCGVSQPTLTRAMVRWENAAGAALFDRSRRRIEFTKPGRELAEAAALALQGLRAALDRDILQTPDSARLFIGSLHSLGQSVVVELTAEYLNKHPTESVRLVEGTSTDICTGVRSGQFDMGIVDRPPDLAGFKWQRLGVQSLSLVLPAADPRASATHADMRDFRDDQFVALDRRFHSRIAADAICTEAGFTANVVLESDEPARLRHYVGDGRGVAILPMDLSINPRVHSLHIDSALAIREFGILCDAARPQPANTRRFIKNMRQIERRYPGWADLLDK